MIYVFEGPNGAGKTTLIKHLMAEIKTEWLYIHNGHSETPWEDYTSQLFGALASEELGGSTFIDRFNVGERVYPYVHGRRPLIGSQANDHFIREAVQMGVHWFIITPPLSALQRNLWAKDEIVDPEELEDELYRFQWEGAHMKHKHPRNVHITKRDNTTEELVKWVHDIEKEVK